MASFLRLLPMFFQTTYSDNLRWQLCHLTKDNANWHSMDGEIKLQVLKAFSFKAIIVPKYLRIFVVISKSPIRAAQSVEAVVSLTLPEFFLKFSAISRFAVLNPPTSAPHEQQVITSKEQCVDDVSDLLFLCFGYAPFLVEVFALRHSTLSLYLYDLLILSSS